MLVISKLTIALPLVVSGNYDRNPSVSDAQEKHRAKRLTGDCSRSPPFEG